MFSTLIIVLTLIRADRPCDHLCTPEAFEHYRRLLLSAKWGLHGEERAAFLIADAEGRLDARRWPSATYYRASYRGAIPRGTVAIIHTHPLNEHEPSAHDLVEAGRVGLPIVVITPKAVTVAYPDGTVAFVVTDGRLFR